MMRFMCGITAYKQQMIRTSSSEHRRLRPLRAKPVISSLEDSGTRQLYSPDRAAHIEWALCLDEGRRLAAEDPYVRVRRLLPHQTRQEAGDTSDFHFHNKVHGFMTELSNRERFLPLRKDRKLDEPRLWRGRHH